MKDFFKYEPLTATLLVLIVVIISFGFVDIFFSKEIHFNGIVIDKHYKSESSSVGTGVVYTSKGMAIVNTYQSSPEEFLVMVKKPNGEVFTVSCEASLFYSKKINQSISCVSDVGYFTKNVWFNECLK
jgi:hypothetical protein